MMVELSLERILVIKLADVGDVLTATPALRALRETYPRARIDLLTTPLAGPAVPRQLVDQVLVTRRNLVGTPGDLRRALQLLAGLKRARYDALLVLHHLTLWAGVAKYRLLAAAAGARIVAGLDNGKGAWLTHRVQDQGFGAMHEVAYCLEVARLLGARSSDPRLAVQRESRDDRVATALLKDSRQPRVAIHPGSGGYSRARRWDPEKWAALADALVRRHKASVILVGTPKDGAGEVAQAMREPVLDLCGRTTLPQLAAVLANCRLFLGADSGVMHVAAAVAVPVVALFGPSNALAWGPWTPHSPSALVRLGPACSPCSYVGHAVGLREGCWHRSCMADLPVQTVLATVESLGDWAHPLTASGVHDIG